ncbi:hypothetical protein TTHERM_00646940 (macronuclear) [Tetrahymena thermophila SB210]|uniref:Transmembrane protein n=1 Tax=Tetrahymena thermophila (strain SB210) TaxID=312017 RepID=I7MJS8_TETTS|nr:hypothetical protein TTHERM_00646940 [Tetrahymena thermophila SB210]EAS07161.2 hypothetical protein TTHERM_00646940 [Tetrahymena thermophila SB210]|eukprot:XP_001027403.2 hypothetical protein TTHERM_00646940 [Tetrahymena thermophila SB210]
MRLVALLILISIIGIEAQSSASAPTTVPNWASSQGFTDFGNCSKAAINNDPCQSVASGSQTQCQTNGGNYLICYTACLNQASYSSFRTCTNACDSTLKTADSTTFSGFITTMDTCFSKLSSKLLTLYVLVFAIFGLLI